MDTRLATTNIRIRQWTAVFKAKAESGLTVDEYCEQNGISRNAYYYWLRRARNTALEHTQTTFVELNVPTVKCYNKVVTGVIDYKRLLNQNKYKRATV